MATGPGRGQFRHPVVGGRIVRGLGQDPSPSDRLPGLIVRLPAADRQPLPGQEIIRRLPRQGLEMGSGVVGAALAQMDLGQLCMRLGAPGIDRQETFPGFGLGRDVADSPQGARQTPVKLHVGATLRQGLAQDQRSGLMLSRLGKRLGGLHRRGFVVDAPRRWRLHGLDPAPGKAPQQGR